MEAMPIVAHDGLREVIDWAQRAGPHVSALSNKNIYLIWDDIQYQECAGFMRIV